MTWESSKCFKIILEPLNAKTRKNRIKYILGWYTLLSSSVTNTSSSNGVDNIHPTIKTFSAACCICSAAHTVAQPHTLHSWNTQKPKSINRSNRRRPENGIRHKYSFFSREKRDTSFSSCIDYVSWTHHFCYYFCKYVFLKSRATTHNYITTGSQCWGERCDVSVTLWIIQSRVMFCPFYRSMSTPSLWSPPCPPDLSHPRHHFFPVSPGLLSRFVQSRITNPVP